MFAQNRPQYLQNSLSYDNFKFRGGDSQNFQKNSCVDKDFDNLAKFYNIVEFFFPGLSLSLNIIRINIAKIYAFMVHSEAVKKVRVKLPPPPAVEGLVQVHPIFHICDLGITSLCSRSQCAPPQNKKKLFSVMHKKVILIRCCPQIRL